LIHISRDVLWAPEPVWRFCRLGTLFHLPAIRTPDHPACRPFTILNTLKYRSCIRKVPVRIFVGIAAILSRVIWFSSVRPSECQARALKRVPGRFLLKSHFNCRTFTSERGYFYIFVFLLPILVSTTQIFTSNSRNLLVLAHSVEMDGKPTTRKAFS
jgi:hypothetical protein